jgi:hypothetical protein
MSSPSSPSSSSSSSPSSSSDHNDDHEEKEKNYQPEDETQGTRGRAKRTLDTMGTTGATGATETQGTTEYEASSSAEYRDQVADLIGGGGVTNEWSSEESSDCIEVMTTGIHNWLACMRDDMYKHLSRLIGDAIKGKYKTGMGYGTCNPRINYNPPMLDQFFDFSIIITKDPRDLSMKLMDVVLEERGWIKSIFKEYGVFYNPGNFGDVPTFELELTDFFVRMYPCSSC